MEEKTVSDETWQEANTRIIQGIDLGILEDQKTAFIKEYYGERLYNTKDAEDYRKHQIKNSMNARYFPKTGEENSMPSMTIPDQTMTIRQLYDRYAKGLPLGGVKEAIYNGDEYVPDPKTLDLTEIDEMKKEAEELGKKLGKQKKDIDKKREYESHKKKWHDEQKNEPK